MSQGTKRIMHLKSEYPEQKYRNLEYIETSICLNGKSMLSEHSKTYSAYDCFMT